MESNRAVLGIPDDGRSGMSICIVVHVMKDACKYVEVVLSFAGAPTCSEIPHSLAWSRKAPSIHDVPRGGTVQVLTNRDVKPSGRVLRLFPAFCLREARWWLQLEVRKTNNLHYTTALHTISPVFSHHTTP